ncbi:PEP-CTERM sorting domain-containing protein [Pseudoduganella armeniaca]|nr:PEP-CTERM sorting domain-containing protein [Pseudoduganella armeniaca]
MLKKLLPVALLALTAATAQATERTWTWTYQGFYNQASAKFDPSFKVSGTFTGDDLNRDGTISLQELTSFEMGYYTADACANEYGAHCYVDAFSFSSDRKLAFKSRHYYIDDGPFSSGTYITTGEKVMQWGYFGPTETYTWTDQTKLTLVQLPVPEPSTYAMFGAGMLVLAGLRARRKAQ